MYTHFVVGGRDKQSSYDVMVGYSYELVKYYAVC